MSRLPLTLRSGVDVHISDVRFSYLVLRILADFVRGRSFLSFHEFRDDLLTLLGLSEDECGFVEWETLDKCLSHSPWENLFGILDGELVVCVVGYQTPI